jgi:8-oxo-dGTP diphosphatase
MTEFYQEKPKNFRLDVEVSTVFIECQRKLLLLQRAAHKVYPSHWAIPGGKLEKGETPLEGLQREVEEELGLSPQAEVFNYIRSVYVKHPLAQYKLHLFQWFIPFFPTIFLNPEEHQAFLWQPIEQFNEIPLIAGQLDAFHTVYPSYNLKESG